jgi:hypothetical protein
VGEMVRLTPASAVGSRTCSEPLVRRLASSADVVADGPAAHLDFAAGLGPLLPMPGRGRTRERWEALATLGAIDLQLARAVEPHADALAILGEADADGHPVRIPERSTWGVFAAEGPGERLVARESAAGWLLDGVKPWCSLAGTLSHALVTAWVDADRRRLFAVDLTHPGVRTETGQAWHARGLRDVVSTAVALADAPAHPVGPTGWYLERDGFWYGGMGVAAVWFGGAAGLARRLARPSSRPLDQLGHLHLGQVDLALSRARAVLAEAAVEVDAGRARGVAAERTALRVRGVVAQSCEEVLTACEHALGPGPQVQEPEYAARLADLRLYLRQHHAERDLAALGRAVADRGGSW